MKFARLPKKVVIIISGQKGIPFPNWLPVKRPVTKKPHPNARANKGPEFLL